MGDTLTVGSRRCVRTVTHQRDSHHRSEAKTTAGIMGMCGERSGRLERYNPDVHVTVASA